MAQNEETLYFDNTHPEVRQESKDKLRTLLIRQLGRK